MLIPFAVKAESVQTGKFRYMPAFEEETQEVYYYSDDYFSKSGKEYNEHLLSMSYNLTLSTFEVRGGEYCTSLLTDTGFQDTGTHTLKLVYIDNVIQAQFVIRKAQKQPSSDGRRYSIPLTGVES